MRDVDFQRLVGLAAEVHRMKQGVTFVVQAAKVVSKHRDDDSIELLISSAKMLAESGPLPERDGHGELKLSAEEIVDAASDSFNIDTDDIPRPEL
jgi:hypothetical protein